MSRRKVKAPIEEFVEYAADEGEDPREYREIREDEERGHVSAEIHRCPEK